MKEAPSSDKRKKNFVFFFFFVFFVNFLDSIDLLVFVVVVALPEVQFIGGWLLLARDNKS